MLSLFYFDKSAPKQDSLFQTVAVDRLKSWISHPKNGLHFNGRINAGSRKESPLWRQRGRRDIARHNR